MSLVFAPGCALMIERPRLAARLAAYLRAHHGAASEHHLCCRHEPGLPPGTRIINVCPGCDRRFRELYPGLSTVSVWEILASDAAFPLPDHGGAEMAVLDACPTRSETRVHDAVRALLTRMNVRIAEPKATRTRAVCCGDSLYGVVPTAEVEAQMRKRAGEMPAAEVAVYCVSCVKAMRLGGKSPRHLVDLLFGEPTEPGVTNPDAWHAKLQQYIDRH